MGLRQDRSKVSAAPPGRSPGVAEPVLDRDALFATVENDFDLLRELVELFLASSPGLLADLRAGLRENDAEKVERAAHALKGAVGNFGARRALEAARVVELNGQNQKLSEAGALLPVLENEVIRLCEALSGLLREVEK
jgi:two-component system sensor histidine kinase/response regulator